MAQILFQKKFYKELLQIDAALAVVQEQKIRFLLGHLPLELTAAEIDLFTGWDKITIPVKDRGMCLQFNRMCDGIPKLRFCIDKDLDGVFGRPR